METESVIAKNIREKEKENRLSKKNELISELQHARKELSVVANIAKYLENKLSREKTTAKKKNKRLRKHISAFRIKFNRILKDETSSSDE